MKHADIDDIDFEKEGGLVPVVVQDYRSKEVLTLAYANYQALELSMETGYAYFYRRSHGKVMKKGATSGNFQQIVDIFTDCDLDAVVYMVEPMGPACHKGDETCFHYRIWHKENENAVEQ